MSQHPELVRARLGIANSLAVHATRLFAALAVWTAALDAEADAFGWQGVVSPSSRTASAYAFDSSRRDIVQIGGSSSENRLRADVWIYHCATARWESVRPSGAPPSARAWASAVYDASRDCIWMIGGDYVGPRSDVWKLTLGASPAWQEINPSGAGFPPLAGCALALDTTRDRILAYGGMNNLTPTSALYALSLAQPAWTLRPAGSGSPGARGMAMAAYDAAGDRLLVGGGSLTRQPGGTQQTWSLSLATDTVWSALPPMVLARAAACSGFDPVSRTWYMFGGFSQDSYRHEIRYVEELQLAAAPPLAWRYTVAQEFPYMTRSHAGAVGVFDAVSRSMFCAGGEYPGNYSHAGQVLRLDLNAPYAWSLAMPAPHARAEVGLAFDPSRGRVVVQSFQQIDDPGTWFGVLDGIQHWEPITQSTGLPPEAGRMIHDPVGDRVVSYLPSSATTWSMDLASPTPSWSQLPIVSSPGRGRNRPAAAYDSKRRRMILFGGLAGTFLNEVFVLDLANPSSWALLTTAGTPPPGLWGPAAAYDPSSDRLLIYGGQTDLGANNATWELDFAGTPTWRALVAQGTPPPPGYQTAGAFDSRRSRFYVCSHANLFVLDLLGAPTWQMIPNSTESPDWGSGIQAAWDNVGNRLILHGGAVGSELLGQTMAYSEPDPVSVSETSAPATELKAYPNPFRQSVRVSFAGAPGAKTRAQVCDLAGRVVRELEVVVGRDRQAGFDWDGRLETGTRAAPGVYLVSILGDGPRSSGRILLLR